MDTPQRILVVDDNPTNALILVKTLEKAGYGTIVASDGFEAVDMATEEKPDLILLDMMMPGRDGMEVCRILKAQDETNLIPIIFVTADSTSESIVNSLSIGGSDYITKPFKGSELLARVSAHLRLRHAERELSDANERMMKLAQTLADANVELSRSSRIDPLTQILNRGAWQEAITLEQERIRRNGGEYGILMLDLDYFKRFNDTQGHQGGDDCLRQVTQCIVSAIRSTDVLGRYGGEEFVVLALDTDFNRAVELAERIRKEVWSLNIPHPGSAIARRVTVSLGVASGGTDTWESVVKRADEGLYAAKKAGRNRVGTGRTEDLPPNPWVSEEPQTVLHKALAGTDEIGLDLILIDRDGTSRVGARTLLEAAGFTVADSAGSREALSNPRSSQAAVIIADASTVLAEGPEILRQWKEGEATREIPILLTGVSAKPTEAFSDLRALADDLLGEHVVSGELLARIRTLIQYRTELRQSNDVRGEQARVMALLLDFSRNIAASESLGQVLQSTLEVIAAMTASRSISIFLPDEQEDMLVVAASTRSASGNTIGQRIPIDDPTAGKVFRLNEHLVIDRDSELADRLSAMDRRLYGDLPIAFIAMRVSECVVGVLCISEHQGQRPFDALELDYIDLIANIAASAIHYTVTRDARDKAHDAIVVALARLAEHRDNDTGKHLDRVTRYSLLLARELGTGGPYADKIDEKFLSCLKRAVPLHDIGKVAIPDSILCKPDALTSEERDIMQTHAEVGATTLQRLVERTQNVSFLRIAEEIARNHHEWFDGSGYPQGIRGHAIPLSARITALADVYDAVTTKRVYKDAFSHEKAVTIITESSGTQFDPVIVEAMLAREWEFAELARTLADDAPAAREARYETAVDDSARAQEHVGQRL